MSADKEGYAKETLESFKNWSYKENLTSKALNAWQILEPSGSAFSSHIKMSAIYQKGDHLDNVSKTPKNVFFSRRKYICIHK